MKAEIIETKKTFEPIEIKLVIESEEELCSLWHRLNVGARAFHRDFYNGSEKLKHKINVDGNNEIWKIIDDTVEKLKL